jgi:heterodisulfide reductase subunit B2
MKYSFYPGCSLQKSSKPYLDSLNAIKSPLGMELKELKDWNCCGATDYQTVHQLPAHALVGRNLAIAQQMGNGSDTTIPVRSRFAICWT